MAWVSGSVIMAATWGWAVVEIREGETSESARRALGRARSRRRGLASYAFGAAGLGAAGLGAGAAGGSGSDES